jgi:hypothetical protein
LSESGRRLRSGRHQHDCAGRFARSRAGSELSGAGATIYRAVPSRPWPGAAALEVAHVWLRKGGDWRGAHALDEKPVTGVTPFLTVPGKAAGNPHRLKAK